MKTLYTLATVLVLAGCGSTANNQATQVGASSNSQVEQSEDTQNTSIESHKCDKDITTGSKFTKKRCRTAE